MVAVELPGVGIDDLEITFEDGLLTIQGQRHVAPDSSEERVIGPNAATAPSAAQSLCPRT